MGLGLPQGQENKRHPASTAKWHSPHLGAPGSAGAPAQEVGLLVAWPGPSPQLFGWTCDRKGAAPGEFMDETKGETNGKPRRYRESKENQEKQAVDEIWTKEISIGLIQRRWALV